MTVAYLHYITHECSTSGSRLDGGFPLDVGLSIRNHLLVTMCPWRGRKSDDKRNSKSESTDTLPSNHSYYQRISRSFVFVIVPYCPLNGRGHVIQGMAAGLS